MSDSDLVPCDLTPHPNRYASLFLDDDTWSSQFNDNVTRTCGYPKHVITSPTSSSTSSTETSTSSHTTAPFWYDNEDSQHIQCIISYYTHALHLRLSHERVHGERSPLVFIGSIRRHVIRMSHGQWRTLDLISTYTRDTVPLGFTMTPTTVDVAYRTTWDCNDGIPTSITRLSSRARDHYMRHIDPSHPISILHATPIYACDSFLYSCDHVSREMGYAGAHAHVIHATAQMIPIPHQSTHLVRSGSEETLSSYVDEDGDDMTYEIHDHDHDDNDEIDDDVSDGSDSDSYDDEIDDMTSSCSTSEEETFKLHTSQQSSPNKSSQHDKSSQQQQQQQQHHHKSLHPSSQHHNLLTDDECGFIIARDGYAWEHDESTDDEYDDDEDDEHLHGIPIHNKHHTANSNHNKTSFSPSFQADLDALMAGLCPPGKTHAPKVCKAGW